MRLAVDQTRQPPPPSAAGPQDRARAAWIGDAAWPAARVAGPRRNARARRTRDTMRDQDQYIEIPKFRVRKTGDNRKGVRKTGDNRKDWGDPQIFPTIGEAPGPARPACRFPLCSLQGCQLAYPPGSSSRKGRWTQAGPIRSP